MGTMRNEYRVPPKPKATGGPKRALSAYMMYCNDNRARMKEENPDMKVTQIMKELANEWNDVKSTKKAKKWLDAAAKAKAEYQELRTEYVASAAYKRWKKAVKKWNELYKEEWMEQEQERKEEREERKKKREEKKKEKASGKKKKTKGKKKKESDEEEEEPEEEEEEEDAEEQEEEEEEENEDSEDEDMDKKTKKKG